MTESSLGIKSELSSYKSITTYLKTESNEDDTMPNIEIFTPRDK